jgi:alkanesulfonate monooxygenase SsuD/methylene tetrahydromethanopterin reductase-like flavin-dependent oxidoreductase (luciferase family)
MVLGTPEQCAEQLLPYVALGVSDFIIGARAPVDYETLELVATKVAPLVRERGVPLMP